MSNPVFARRYDTVEAAKEGAEKAVAERPDEDLVQAKTWRAKDGKIGVLLKFAPK